MPRHRPLGYFLLIVLIPSVALLLGCPAPNIDGVYGERWSGGCPRDERCSDATPDGLIFGSADGAFILPVAVGGTQRIHISVLQGNVPVFDALSSSSNIEVTNVTAFDFALLGVAPGQSTVRIVERTGGALLDRMSFETAAVERVVVSNALSWIIDPLPEPRPIVFAPGVHEVRVSLIDVSGRRLVDESMTVDGARAPNGSAYVAVSEAGLDLAITAAGTSHTMRLDPAGEIDDIELLNGSPAITPGGGVCTLALSGGSWVVPARSTTSIFTLDDIMLEPDPTFPNCAIVPEDIPVGSAELTIEIGGFTRTFDVAVLR